MISVIFYGRNDNHGYNLHKRASLSLNNIAELLTNQDDEILFVDWNTPPGLPTFIESIHDLLTYKAKKLTKVIKVDFNIHDQIFGSKTDKQTVEPVARNAAITRSNSKNKWVLSTNTDMIFVPRNSDKSLSDICSELNDGFYELPRFSIPEIIWETFDRLNPNSVVDRIRELRIKIDLDEIITAGPILRYDAPGDFQLCLREQLFEIRGFDENMILGWHVDSNLCRRLNILNGETKSLESELYGYHCEHTKTTTQFTSTHIQNSLVKFVERIDSPYSSKKDEEWGLSNIELKQFYVDREIEKRFEILFDYSRPPNEPRSSVYANSMGNLVGYPETHSIPYLIDAVYGYPDNVKILFFCHSKNRMDHYQKILERLGFNNFADFIEDKNFDYIIGNIEQPIVIVIDLGFEIDGYDVSSITHDELNNKFTKNQLRIISNFLNFVIRNSKNTLLYKIPIITLNVETYDLGPGTWLKRWLQLPQAASNSRVRIGFLRKSLKNRNTDTLQKLLKHTISQINFLGDRYFDKLSINPKMLDKQGLQLTSHQLVPYSNDYSGVSITRRGVMLKKFGYVNFDLSQIYKDRESLIVVEMDRPRVDGNNYDVTGKFEINSSSFPITWKKNENNALSISYNPGKQIDKIKISFKDLNYDRDHKALIRLTNFGVFKLAKLNHKLILMRSGDLRARYYLQDNWSFSNEGTRRWTTDSTFSLHLNRQKTNGHQWIAIEINYYKSIGKNNFVKKIRSDKFDEDLKFIEIPRINRRRGRIVFIFVPNQGESIITIETNSYIFEPFEFNLKESRKICAQVGAIGVSDGRVHNLLLFFLFPPFIVWVEFVKNFLGMVNNIKKRFIRN